MCLKSIDANSIVCGGCSSWVHNRSSGVSGHLKPGSSFRCKWCTGQVRPVDRPMAEVTMGQEKLEAVPSVCYLGTAYHQVVVVNSPPSQEAVSHGVNWISSCLSPARPHLPLISYQPQRKSVLLVRQVCHAPCKRNLGPNLIWLTSPATQWLSCWMCGVTTKNQVSSQDLLGMDCLELGLTETSTSDRKAWSSRLRCAVRLDPPTY